MKDTFIVYNTQRNGNRQPGIGQIPGRYILVIQHVGQGNMPGIASHIKFPLENKLLHARRFPIQSHLHVMDIGVFNVPFPTFPVNLNDLLHHLFPAFPGFLRIKGILIKIQGFHIPTNFVLMSFQTLF